MTEELLPIIYTAMGLGLIALYPAWMMYQKAFYTSKGWYRLVTLLFCLILPPLIAGVCYFIPFQLAQGNEKSGIDMFTDFVIFAICPAAVVALAGWVGDFIADRERPRRPLLGGAALCAIALLPPAYYWFAEDTLQAFDVTVESSTDEM